MAGREWGEESLPKAMLTQALFPPTPQLQESRKAGQLARLGVGVGGERSWWSQMGMQWMAALMLS